ncbi:MAG: hypothetical protein U0228_09865 [Myxococcaceae bacterium]
MVALGLLVGLFWCEATGRRFWQVPWRSRETPEVHDAAAAARLRAKAHVILFTLDGPITDDVRDPLLMPRLHAAIARQGLWLDAHVASASSLSLPGYQALAVGRLTDCTDNDCERVQDETTADFLARALQWSPDQAAVFGSWSRLALAVSSEDGGVTVDTPPEGDSKPDRPWRNARLDVETFARAFDFWREHHPRFLQLSLLDADEWAHRGDRERYRAALMRSDVMLGAFLDEVALLPPDERALTTVLVTSDHGRGAFDWREHQPWDYGGGPIFFVALGEGVARDAKRELVDQRDVRWTIERLFGVCTAARRPPGAGHPIEALVHGLPCDD